jgi:uncharacterized protein YukE
LAIAWQGIMRCVTLQVDQAAFRRAVGLTGDIKTALTKEYAAIRADVDDLLAGWGGVAAEQFGKAWGEWCEGMTAVLDGIGLDESLLGVVRAEVDGTDQDRKAALAALHAKLGRP